MSLRARRFACLLLVVGLSWIAGCGVRESTLPESGASLTGTITYKGKPIEFAMVRVQSKDGKQYASGQVNDDGKYRVDNVPLGEVMIAVDTAAAQGEFVAQNMAKAGAAADPKASKKRVDPTFVNVPQKYSDPAKSGLSTTIQKGENTFDITCAD